MQILDVATLLTTVPNVVVLVMPMGTDVVVLVMPMGTVPNVVVLVMPMGTTDWMLTPEARLYGQRLAHAKASTPPRRASQLPVPLGPLSTLWQVLEEL
jgi:hypothetical protein